ncbi:MAG: tautomerase family protein [Acidimicrobiales bacterium]
MTPVPFYHALVRPNLLTESQRQRFATDVVDVHCDVTGAPRSFVHVLVTEDHDQQLPEEQAAAVNGTIRSGRNADQKAEIATRINVALATTADVALDTVSTTTRDINASHTMEGGVLLPEPGSQEEAAWISSS